MLKAYFDDSGNEPNSGIFVLAGLVADAGEWVAFARDWRAALKRHELVAFKWNHASKLVGHCKGWSEEQRDAVLVDLTKIIVQHVCLRVRSSVRHDDFAAFIRSLPAPERTLATDTPYFWVWHRAFTQTFVGLIDEKMSGPVDFIFDTQTGYEEEFWRHWPRLSAIIERRQQSLDFQMLREKPLFASDDLFPQLQAADLYAGAARRFLIDGSISPSLKSLTSIPESEFEWSMERLALSRQRLIEDGERIHLSSPDLAFRNYDPVGGKRERKRSRSKNKK